jgi:phage terminase small subunit
MTKRLSPPSTWDAELSERERRFVLEYIVDLNATQAALRAKYGKGNTKSARDYATQLRRKRNVAEAISALIAERYGATQARVLEELAKLAFYDIGDAVTVAGGAVVVRDFDELDPDVRAAIVGVEERVNDKGHRTVVVKLADKNVALKTLAACLNMRRSPTDGPSVAVQVNVTNHHEAANRIAARLDAVLQRQQAALPPPSQTPIDVEFAPVRVPELVESK